MTLSRDLRATPLWRQALMKKGLRQHQVHQARPVLSFGDKP